MAHLPPGGPRKVAAPVSEHSFLAAPRAAGIPLSFQRDGFVTPDSIRQTKRLLIGIEGESDTGKTEFSMSSPGPGLGICLDRGIDGALNNDSPPAARHNNWAFKIVQAPLPTQAVQRAYLDYWQEFYKWYKMALENADSRTVLVDGDSDSWELQKLAEFGKLTQIPPIMYTNVNAARRAMYARAWDSGKIVIFTNKVKAEYIDEMDKNGNPVMGNDGKPKRVKSGELERQGFPDQDYLFHIQLRALYNSDEQQWGIRIMKCKNNRSLIGQELWGDECNFAGLVQTVYPDVPLEKWGL